MAHAVFAACVCMDSHSRAYEVEHCRRPVEVVILGLPLLGDGVCGAGLGTQVCFGRCSTRHRQSQGLGRQYQGGRVLDWALDSAQGVVNLGAGHGLS